LLLANTEITPMKNNPPLALKRINPRLIEDLTEEAESYFANEPSPFIAKDKEFVLAYYNDAPGGIGGGTRCALWFKTAHERLEVLANYLLLTNPGPLDFDYPGVSQKICDLVEVNWKGELETPDLISQVNSLTKQCFQIEWIGARSELLDGSEDFPKWLRAQWRSADPEDGSPLKPYEVAGFLDYLACDYMC
jgi:hypothetical protein